MSKCLLFVYGLLQPGFHPPRTLSQAWPDSVRCELYNLGPYPAAVKVGAVEHWTDGWVLEIDEQELAALDEYEDVDAGQYARRWVTTRGGREAWMYEYLRSVEGLPQIARWPAEKVIRPAD
jgi:gamma-glutamylcyclotransferase (GGCT)/AIG2-like uncharacterized protein YtfP